jgi:hypothetical protein
LGDRSLADVIEAYLGIVAVARRKVVSQAVEESMANRAPKAQAKDGKRPALNPKYVENTASWLPKFAATFVSGGDRQSSKVISIL